MAFENLQDRNFMSLTTYRKNGDPVATPVWFAQVEDKLYVTTSADTGKVKRIRNNASVTVAPCTARGEVLGAAVTGAARILGDPAEAKLADSALNQKYGWQKRAFELFQRVGRLFRRSKGGTEGGTTFLEIIEV